jgi:3-keto-L-gulonate-6-phosphate decarboxylase
MLPGLTVGICEDSLAAKAFAESNMRVVIVGGARVEAKDVVRRASWSELAEKGS